MKNYKNAFTMIELVFVIVVLGILSAVAIPKFAVTRTDAQIVKAKADVASIRAAIVNERQVRLFRGQPAFIARLDAGVGAGAAGVLIFDNNGSTANQLLQYGIRTKAGNGGWLKATNTTYTFTVQNVVNTFTYAAGNGTFLCTNGAYCRNLAD